MSKQEDKELTFWKKYQRMRLVAFSCHETALRVLESWVSANTNAARIHLYEYFLESPSVISSPAFNPNLFLPFVDREVAARGICLAIPEDTKDESTFLKKIVEVTNTAKENPSKPFPFTLPLAFSGHLDPAQLVKRLFRMGPINNGSRSPKLYGRWMNAEGVEVEKRTVNREDCIDEMHDKLSPEEIKETAFRLGWANIFAILYSPLITRPDCADELHMALAPIASSNAFYGTLSLVVEITRRDSGFKIDGVFPKLVSLAQKVYLPTLILTQNSWEEEQLGIYLEKKRTDWRAGFSKALPQSERVYSNRALVKTPTTRNKIKELFHQKYPEVIKAAEGNYDLECALLSLWNRRFHTKNQKRVKDSLIFNKLMVASPGLLGTVRESLHAADAISPRKKANDPFPAVLVVGSAGSGKENIARLVPLFTADYWSAKRVDLNMASIRSIQDLEKELLLKAGKTTRVVIGLDELNSLDIVTQGGMLRILEQGHFSQPSSVANKKNSKVIEWMIMGMINEDPAQLTLGEIRERTRDTFIFGHLLGALLYEHFKTRSRMRDDLYYRIRRCGEIHVADLDERREDVPIILYFLLARSTNKELDFFLTYEALKLLVGSRLQWKGNVRQLELVAREVASISSSRMPNPPPIISTSRSKKAKKKQKEFPTSIITAEDIELALIHAKVPGAIMVDSKDSAL